LAPATVVVLALAVPEPLLRTRWSGRVHATQPERRGHRRTVAPTLIGLASVGDGTTLLALIRSGLTRPHSKRRRVQGPRL